MATLKKSGRPRKKDADKVKVASAYITRAEELRIKKKYGSITKALREAALPQCV